MCHNVHRPSRIILRYNRQNRPGHLYSLGSGCTKKEAMTHLVPALLCTIWAILAPLIAFVAGYISGATRKKMTPDQYLLHGRGLVPGTSLGKPR